MGLSLPYKFNCVVLITCDDSSKFRKEDSEREWALVRFVLLNLCSELIEGKGYVVETERNQLALMLNMADTLEEAVQAREAIIADIKKITEERFHMKITIASSTLQQGIENFGKCYIEATSALDYKIIHGIGSVIYYEQIKDLKHNYYYYPVEEEIRFINYMKSGNYDEAERLLDMLYEKNIASGEMTSEMGKFLIFDLLSTVIKVMEALKIDDKQLLKGIDPIRSIMDGTSAQDMVRKTKELCGLICNSVAEARKDQVDGLNGQIKEYVSEHLLDHSLSLTSIADYFNMNPQYISSFFKKHNHMNLTEYIVAKRMDEAKLMLRDSNLTMLQIALKIGYANDIGFIRAFKKYEGITPGKYREMVRNLDTN
jgi:YesN/AraC family two-component response regulator